MSRGVVETATFLRRDHAKQISVKHSLYAILKIQEYWVVNLRNDCLLAYTDPKEDTYQTGCELHRGDSLAPRLLPDCLIRLDAFLS